MGFASDVSAILPAVLKASANETDFPSNDYFYESRVQVNLEWLVKLTQVVAGVWWTEETFPNASSSVHQNTNTVFNTSEETDANGSSSLQNSNTSEEEQQGETKVSQYKVRVPWEGRNQADEDSMLRQIRRTPLPKTGRPLNGSQRPPSIWHSTVPLPAALRPDTDSAGLLLPPIANRDLPRDIQRDNSFMLLPDADLSDSDDAPDC
eukprot:g14896.t1